jgi:hypothetical protein
MAIIYIILSINSRALVKIFQYGAAFPPIFEKNHGSCFNGFLSVNKLRRGSAVNSNKQPEFAQK